MAYVYYRGMILLINLESGEKMKLIKLNIFKAILPVIGISYKKVFDGILVTGFYRKIW